MDSASLIDLGPAARLALMGIVVALGPLVWLWLRHRGEAPARRLHKLALLTLFLTFDLVVFGTFTRLTDSGLGCPDWPGCYGHASPLGAQGPIDAAQNALPSGPVTHGKAWVEMVHRYLATGVGVLITVMAIGAWTLQRGTARQNMTVPSPWWATVTLAWVIAQGAFGALTVTMKLYPAIVTLHLLGGLGLLVLLVVQDHAFEPRPLVAEPTLRAMAWLAGVLVIAQAALGGWVSTNYAVLACSDFPTCQGQWWPPMDFAHAFTLQRELGQTAAGSFLPFEALTAIHVTHRMAAALVFIVTGTLVWCLHRQGGTAERAYALGLAALLAAQFASGLGNVVLGWPIVAALMHTGGAALLVSVLAALLARMQAGTRVARPAAPLASVYNARPDQ